MTIVVPDREAVAAALARESTRVADLISGCRDLSAPVPGLDWTVGQLTAHVTGIYFAFAQSLRGGDWDDLDPVLVERTERADQSLPSVVATANEHALELFAADSPATAAQGLTESAAELSAAFAAQADLAHEVPTPWYGAGRTRTVGTLVSLAVTESLLHGRDLAKAVGADLRMSRISAAAAASTVMSAMLPLLLDPKRAGGFTATYALRLRGGSDFAVRVENGVAECFGAGEKAADCVILLDPCTALLLGFGRQSLARSLLGGGVVAYGRKPWLGPRFPSLFCKA